MYPGTIVIGKPFGSLNYHLFLFYISTNGIAAKTA